MSAAALSRRPCGIASVGVRECNRGEAIFLPPAAVSPSVNFGATVDAACGSGSARSDAVSLAQLHRVYAAERYMLAWRGGRGHVLLRSDHTGHDLLKVRRTERRSLCLAIVITGPLHDTVQCRDHTAAWRLLAST